MFEKQYLSNVMYELSMNGMQISTENISAILGSGFINKSSAFNKRSQIWFTNGWAGDKEFIKKEKGLNLTKEGNYNYIIAQDLTKKDAKLNHNLIKLLNNQNPEHVDGAILIRDDLLKSINKDFGTESSTGQNK